MFFLDIINIWHLGRRYFIILIKIISWGDKICVIWIILKVIFVRIRTKFLFNGDGKLPRSFCSVGDWILSLVIGLTDDMYMTLSFFFRILRVIAGPISMAAPKSLP
jgi:hypothetical protein